MYWRLTFVGCFVLPLLFASCSDSKSTSKDSPKKMETSSVFSFKITTQEDGYGYEVLKNRRAFIKQPNIPAIEGQKSFATKEQAITTAKFVIEKLKKGTLPPSVTIQELDSLGIDY